MLKNLLQGMCSDENTPDTISVYMNGTTTVLMKMVAEDGSVSYVGTPAFQDRSGKKKVGEHSLVMSADGHIEGTYALNSIAVGGWVPKVSKDPGQEARTKIMEHLQSTLITCAVLSRQGKDSEATPLEEAIRIETGFDVIKKPMSEDELEVVAAYGLRNHLIEILVRRGWSLNITPRHLVRKLSGYCEIVKGPWDSEASKIATTGAISFSTVKTLKSLGYTIRKLRRASRRQSATS